MRYEVWIGEKKTHVGATRILSMDTVPTLLDLVNHRQGLLLEVCFLWPFEARWHVLEKQFQYIGKRKGSWYCQLQLFGMELLDVERKPIYLTVFGYNP